MRIENCTEDQTKTARGTSHTTFIYAGGQLKPRWILWLLLAQALYLADHISAWAARGFLVVR